MSKAALATLSPKKKKEMDRSAKKVNNFGSPKKRVPGDGLGPGNYDLDKATNQTKARASSAIMG